MTKRCLGIDLGTSASAIGWVLDGRPSFIEVDGDRLVPSVVYAPPGGAALVAGRAAVEAELEHPERVLRSTKRHMGTDKTWDLGDRTLTPVDAATAILSHLAAKASESIGSPVQRVVITVPAWFTQAQRADTRTAGERAGLEVVRLLNEPTAAALAHAHGTDLSRLVLVYDYGGGTFDVSLVDQEGPVLEVRASHGDVHLGGDDVDRALMDWVHDQLAKEAPELGEAIAASVGATRRLRGAVEAAKLTLSKEARATVHLPALVTLGGQPQDLTLRLPREELEELLMPMVSRTIALVDAVLADADVHPSQVDELLLVGGSVALPQVFRTLRARYGLDGDTRIPPRHAVALGAAVQAAIVDGSRVDGVLIDVAPYPISIGVMTGGVPGFPTHFTTEVITPRNTPLPSHHTHLVRTGHPQQERIRLPVYQGADPDPRHNVILGEVVMTDLPHAPHGELFRPVAIEVEHDLDGTVEITIRDQWSDRTTVGKVVADGTEVAELRGIWEAHAIEHELAFGDPYAARDLRRVAPTPEAVRVAKALFAWVLAKEDEVRAQAGPLAPAILDRARRGQTATEDTEIVLTYENLQDDCFEGGVYL